MKFFHAMMLITFTASCGQMPAQSQISDDSDPVYTADNCLGDQDLNLADIDVSLCPELPPLPEDAPFGNTEEVISLGAWELGQTAEGATYKYGTLSEPGTEPRVLTFYEEEEFTVVNAENLTCWAKGYYRIRKILQNPPADYVKLRAAGFQVRFFQFQTDLRNGTTGFREISSYLDHLIKWVTVIEEDGSCVQPTLQQFEDYVAAELVRRGIQ